MTKWHHIKRYSEIPATYPEGWKTAKPNNLSSKFLIIQKDQKRSNNWVQMWTSLYLTKKRKSEKAFYSFFFSWFWVLLYHYNSHNCKIERHFHSSASYMSPVLATDTQSKFLCHDLMHMFHSKWAQIRTSSKKIYSGLVSCWLYTTRELREKENCKKYTEEMSNRN